jgi:hypothetical protein
MAPRIRLLSLTKDEDAQLVDVVSDVKAGSILFFCFVRSPDRKQTNTRRNQLYA